MVKKKWANSAKPLQITPENAGNHNSEALKLKIFSGSMPPDPPRGYRLWWAFIWTPLHEILDPPQKIPLENAGNSICKTLDFKFSWGWGCLLFFISHPLQNLLRIDKESEFLAMSTIKFICPCTLLERQPSPDPSLLWGPSAPIAVYFQNITVYFKSYFDSPVNWIKYVV